MIFFFCHNFQTKIRLLIISTFYVYIGTVEFSSLFKESPCSPVVTFPSFVSKCHGAQPRRGTFFPYLCACSTLFMSFCTIFFPLCLKLSHANAKKPFKKAY